MDITLIDDVELDRRLQAEADLQRDVQLELRAPETLEFAPFFSPSQSSSLIHWV